MEPIQKLRMKNVTRRFGATTALNNFNLEITGGSFVTFLGPSGCGKSTALNCLAGLLDLSQGEIILNGRPIHQVAAEKRGFGMVFQNYALFPHLTVFRNVSYGLEIQKVARVERERRVHRSLAMVHLEDFEKRYPAQLSGGQQQRLAIARTIVLEPNLLLLDEPLSNLDANLRNEMRIEIKRIHSELGLTTVYVTHDQSEAMSLSNQVVVMRQGSIEQSGTPQEIYMQPGSLYVAHFMGYANRLPVKIVASDERGFLVQTAGGIQLRATSTEAESLRWQPGQQVIACCRPDETQVEDTLAANRLQGRVQLVEYMGKSFEILVYLENDGDAQRLLVHSRQPFAEGSTIDFGISPSRLLLFKDDDAVEQGDPVQPVPSLSALDERG